MKKIQLLSIFILIHLSSFATHIVGGDISVKYLSPNTFELKLRFYRDCSPGTAAFDLPTIRLGLFDKITHVRRDSFDIPFITSKVIPLGDSCYTPGNICVEEGIYIDTVTIPNNPNGYYISWQRCCRNAIIQNIVNPGAAGMVFYAEIPDPVLQNSTPTFGPYPNNAYFCSSISTTQNFTCTDIDGDVLVYSMETPLNGNASSLTPIPPTSSGPYSFITWLPPYSAADMLGGVPPISINPNTGILSAAPVTLGSYVFAVKVEEFRNGTKIGEIRRDIQYQVINCPSNQAPAFVNPTTDSSSYSIIAGDSICIPIVATDPNPDWITLTATSPELFGGGDVPYLSFTKDSAQTTVQSLMCFLPRCEHIRDAPYHVTLYVKDSSCYGVNIVRNDIDFYVLSPISGGIDSIIPNVFTPNGDGLNEVFRINVNVLNFCFDEFNVEVYNRWGKKVFESNDFFFQWDGKMPNGSKAKDGVYFYIINAKFENKNSTYKGSVHLFR